MKKNIKKISIFLMLLLTMFLLSCKGNNSSFYKNTIKIGVYTSLTGDNEAIGKSEIDGARYANKVFDKIDINGEIYKIDLVEIDNKSGDNVDSTVKKLLNEKINFALIGYDDNISIEASKSLSKENLMTIYFSSSNRDLYSNNKYAISLCPDDTFIGPVMANVVKNTGVNNVVIISENDDENNKYLNKYLLRALEKFSINVIDNVLVPKNTSNYKNIISNIKDKEPEYIILNTTYKNSAIALKYIKDAGINCKILSKDFWEYSDIIDKAASNCDGIDFISYFDRSNMKNMSCEKFIYGDGTSLGFSDYLKENQKEDYIYSHAALSYDAYMMLYNAIKNTNSLDYDTIIKYICNNVYDGVIGSVSYDESKSSILDSITIKSINDGKPEFKENIIMK